MFYSFYKILQNFNITPTGVIHVGAHNGSDVHFYLKQNIPHGHFFEPIRSNFLQAVENCKNTNYKCYNVALGCEIGEAQMFTEQDNRGESCSILEPQLHLNLFPHIKFTGKEKVVLNTLDNYKITDCNFLNMDVQGYELEVLKGSTKTLNNIQILYTEINRAEVYKNCAQLHQLVDFLVPYGFQLIETDWYQDGCWGDGLFIKK